MSLANDPDAVPPRDPATHDCVYCHRRTHAPRGVCPDCRMEIEYAPRAGGRR